MSAPAITDRYPSRLDTEAPPITRTEPVVWGATDGGPLAPPALTQMSEQGFLIRPSTVDEMTVATLRNEINRVPSQLGDDPRIIREAGSQEVRSIFEAHVLSSVVMDVACSPGVLDVAEQLLGGPVYLHQSRINAMPAFRGRGFYWHSDFETWHTEDGLPQMRTVSCSIALTVNVAYNGTLQVMPGTHRTFYPCVGATPSENHRKSLVEQEIGVPSTQTLADAALTSGIELFLGQPGDALWFDCNLMHGSGSNISPYPRSNVFLVFNSVENAPGRPFSGSEPRPDYIAARNVTPLTPPIAGHTLMTTVGPQDSDTEPPPVPRPDFESPEGRRLLHRAIAASAMGNATEWYDYGVYAATTTFLTQAFFPTLGTAFTMLGYAISFLLRPLGGMIWGPLGDKLGRKSVMALTIVLMALSTTLIGVLPSWATIGAAAPALLILLRVVQGFSTGGEYGGAATFMAEFAPDKKRGKYGSFLEFGTLGGFATGAAFVLVLDATLSAEDMHDWGWRIPFLVALPMGLIGWYLRSRLDDPPLFVEVQQQAPEGRESAFDRLRDLVRDYRRPMIVMILLVIALNITNYTLLSYQPTYLKTRLGMSETEGQMVILIGEVAMMVFIPFCGALSDRVGRKPMWMFSLIGLLALALPMFWLMGQGLVWAIVGFAVLGLLYIPQLSTITATFPCMFPTQVRYAGFAISYNLSTAAFGGTAPLVNDLMIETTGWDLFPAAYLMLACVVGLCALPFLIETAGASIAGTDIPCADGAEPAEPDDVVRA